MNCLALKSALTLGIAVGAASALAQGYGQYGQPIYPMSGMYPMGGMQGGYAQPVYPNQAGWGMQGMQGMYGQPAYGMQQGYYNPQPVMGGMQGMYPAYGMQSMYGMYPMGGMAGSYPMGGMVGMYPMSGMYPMGGMQGMYPMGGMTAMYPMSGMVGMESMAGMVGMAGMAAMESEAEDTVGEEGSAGVKTWSRAHRVAEEWVADAGLEDVMVGKIRRVGRIYLISIVDRAAPHRLRDQLVVRREDGRMAAISEL